MTEEILRRREVNSNVNKLWVALRGIIKEENEKRKEFNKSKYYQNILLDEQQRELKALLPISEENFIHASYLEETKVAPSTISSLRAFLNKGTLFRSID